MNDIQPTDYAALSRQFDHIYRDPRGFDYFTGEQCITRLNEQGPGFWDFEIVEHGINVEADEVWVLGKLTCRFVVPALDGDGYRVQTVARMQFGSDKIGRLKNGNKIQDIGFDLKGAATDALKKCASMIGVGLYLWHRPGGIPVIPDDGVPAEAEYVESTAETVAHTPLPTNGTAGRGARRCSAKIEGNPDETCGSVLAEGEEVMASMREFDRPFCRHHAEQARKFLAAAKAREVKATGQPPAGTVDAPESPPEASTATQSPETIGDTPTTNGATSETPSMSRARQCEAKIAARGNAQCDVKLYPGAIETYGNTEYPGSVLIAWSVAAFGKVYCGQHYTMAAERFPEKVEAAKRKMEATPAAAEPETAYPF